jgi:hypothetical protein|tara:strand:+ start:727 stop:912 length:186 start_codon:yes stop_codon:yes gene_type:complete
MTTIDTIFFMALGIIMMVLSALFLIDPRNISTGMSFLIMLSGLVCFFVPMIHATFQAMGDE